MVSGNFTAPYITPSVNWISQWTVLITSIVIIGLIIYCVINYAINRKNPEKPHKEVEAIKELTKEISKLRDTLEKGGKNGL